MSWGGRGYDRMSEDSQGRPHDWHPQVEDEIGIIPKDPFCTETEWDPNDISEERKEKIEK